MVVGSQARILYSDQEGRVKIALAFNKAVQDGSIKVLYVFFIFLRYTCVAITECVCVCVCQQPETFKTRKSFCLFEVSIQGVLNMDKKLLYCTTHVLTHG